MSGNRHQSVANQAPLGGMVPNDIDRLSSKADYGSSSEDSLSCGEASDSSPPYTGSPPPFDSLTKEIASWTEGSADSAEKYLWGVESLIAMNIQEARSISHACSRAHEKLKDFESALVHSTNTSIVSRRHHVDTVDDQLNANTTWKKSESDRFGAVAVSSQDSSSSRLGNRTTSDPEKQELIDDAITSHKYHYGGGYTVLGVAFVLGIVLWLGGFDPLQTLRY